MQDLFKQVLYNLRKPLLVFFLILLIVPIAIADSPYVCVTEGLLSSIFGTVNITGGIVADDFLYPNGTSCCNAGVGVGDGDTTYNSDETYINEVADVFYFNAGYFVGINGNWSDDKPDYQSIAGAYTDDNLTSDYPNLDTDSTDDIALQTLVDTNKSLKGLMLNRSNVGGANITLDENGKLAINISITDSDTTYTADETNITLDGFVFRLLPLDLAEHINSLNWITNAVSDLVNYLTKTETNTLLADINNTIDTKLNITDQRYNETSYIDAVNDSDNINNLFPSNDLTTDDDTIYDDTDVRQSIEDNQTETLDIVKDWNDDNSTADRDYTDVRVDSIVNTTDETIQEWINENVTEINSRVLNTSTDFGGDISGTFDAIAITKNYNDSTEIAKVKVDNATNADTLAGALPSVYLDNTDYCSGGTCSGNLIITKNLTILGDEIIANVTTQNLNGSFLPQITSVFDIGSPSFLWDNVYAITIYGSLIGAFGNTNFTELYYAITSRWNNDNSSSFISGYDNITYYNNRLNETINASIDLRVNETIDEPSIIRNINKSWVNKTVDEPTILRSTKNESYFKSFDSNASTACDDDYYLDGNGLCIPFNATVIDINKITYYNATTIEVVAGAIEGGDIDSIKTFDGLSINISEASATPGLDIRVNFTGITEFNQLIIRYRTSPDTDHEVNIELYDFVNSVWEDHDFYIESTHWDNPYIPIWDSSIHVGTGDYEGQVWVRIYMDEKGKAIHVHQYDFIQLSLGTGTFSSIETDPLSYHKNDNIDADDYNITVDVIFANDWNRSIYYPLASSLPNVSMQEINDSQGNWSLDKSDYQKEIGEDCSAGDFVKGIDDDGTLDCDTPIGGGGAVGDKWLDDGDWISPNSSFAPIVNASEFTVNLQINISEGGIKSASGVSINASEFYDDGVLLTPDTTIANCSGATCDVTNTGTLDGYEGADLLDNTFNSTDDIINAINISSLLFDFQILWARITGIPADIADGDDTFINNTDMNVSNAYIDNLELYTVLDESYIDSAITRDSDLAYIANCSGKDCIIGWGNLTGIPTDIADGDDYEADTTIANCSTQYSCSPIVYAGNITFVTDNAYNTEGELTTLLDDDYVDVDEAGGSANISCTGNNCYLNISCTDWLGAGLCDGTDADTPDTTIGNCSGADCIIGWGNLTGIPTDIADGDDYEADTTIANCSGATCDVTNTGTLDGYEASALLDDTNESAKVTLIIDTYIPDNATALDNRDNAINESTNIQSFITLAFIKTLGLNVTTELKAYFDTLYTSAQGLFNNDNYTALHTKENHYSIGVVTVDNTSFVTDNAYNTEAELTGVLNDNYMDIDKTFGNESTRVDLIIEDYIPDNSTDNKAYTDTRVDSIDNHTATVDTTIGNESVNVALIIDNYIPNNSTADRGYTDARVESIDNISSTVIIDWIDKNSTYDRGYTDTRVDSIDNHTQTVDTNETARVDLIIGTYIPDNTTADRTYTDTRVDSIDNHTATVDTTIGNESAKVTLIIDTYIPDNSTADRSYADTRVDSMNNLSETDVEGFFSSGDGNITYSSGVFTLANLALSQFNNDLTWITAAVAALDNFFTKTETDTYYWNESDDIDNDEIAEAKIAFSTACDAGKYYRLTGNDLECTTPTDTTYSALSEFANDINAITNLSDGKLGFLNITTSLMIANATEGTQSLIWNNGSGICIGSC